MKIACINNTGNKGNTFVAQDTSTDSLPHQANSNNPYLTPDYFLFINNAHYYNRRYGSSSNNHNLKPQSKHSKIARVASIVLVSLGLLVTGSRSTGIR